MESSQSSSQTLVSSSSKPELVVPGTFVVLQGIPGDGFANTIDSHPILLSDDDEMDEEQDEEADDTTDLDGVVVYEPRTENTVFATSSNSTLLPPTLTTLSVQPLLSTTSGLKTIPPTREDSFIVVEDEQPQQAQASQSVVPPAASTRTLSARETRAVETWNTKRRRKELEGRKEWLEVQDGSLNPPTQHATEEQRLQNDIIRTHAWMQKENASLWWLDSQGRLALMKGLPKRAAITGIVLRSTIGSLDPGTTIIGTQLVCLDTTTFREIPMEVSVVDGSQVFPQGRPGWLQLLKIVSPSEGWIVYSIDGPSFLGPGLTNLYVEPNSWMWRVTCSVGAYVREGVEISLHSSKHIETLPYGTVMEVKRKMINVAGLARLRIRAVVVDDGKTKNDSSTTTTTRVVEGWISEALNPMSGQDGPIAQPIPFPLPALYKVTLKAGAVIRSGIELMSTKVGHAPVGSILSVVGRAFSELPQDKCVERLRLAGDGGWISIRLCEDPPNDELIVELVGIDGSFDPPSPGVFHLDAQLRVTEEQSQSSLQEQQQQQQPHVPGVEETRHHDLSDIGSSDSSGCASPRRKKPTVSRLPPPSRQHEQVCLICLTAERNATLIHGEIGHICCCLKCARILKQSGKSCPMCRLPIDLVIQHFYA